MKKVVGSISQRYGSGNRIRIRTKMSRISNTAGYDGMVRKNHLTLLPFKLQNGVFRSIKERQEQETQRLRRDLDAAQAAARTALTQAEQLRTQLSDLQARPYSFPTMKHI